MGHLMEKETLARANEVLLLTFVGGGLAACALGALAHDMSRWLGVEPIAHIDRQPAATIMVRPIHPCVDSSGAMKNQLDCIAKIVEAKRLETKDDAMTSRRQFQATE